MDIAKFIENYINSEQGANADFDKVLLAVTDAELNEPRKEREAQIKAIYEKVNKRIKDYSLFRSKVKEATEELIKRNREQGESCNNHTLRG